MNLKYCRRPSRKFNELMHELSISTNSPIGDNTYGRWNKDIVMTNYIEEPGKIFFVSDFVSHDFPS